MKINGVFSDFQYGHHVDTLVLVCGYVFSHDVAPPCIVHGYIFSFSHGGMDPLCIAHGRILHHSWHGSVVYFWWLCFVVITEHGYAHLGYFPLQD